MLTYSAKEILEKAQRGGYAIGAFNAANIETIKAIVRAADKLRSPVIIESSSGETEYFGAKNMADVIANYREEYKIPILLNLDHSLNEEAAQIGIDAGYDLVHIDASELAYEENVNVTSKVAVKAHARNLLVEGEIDHITGSSTLHAEIAEGVQAQGHYTDPDQAADFVNKTGIDTLASFIGNVHGVFASPEQLDIERLRVIRKKVECFLSLHGGSGIPEDQVKAAIAAGIVKVNVNTEMRVAFRQGLEKALAESDEQAIYKITPLAIKMVQDVVEKKILMFGSAGKA